MKDIFVLFRGKIAFLIPYMVGIAFFIYFFIYKLLYIWCVERPNYQIKLSDPPLSLRGCLSHRSIELVLSPDGLVAFGFMLLLFFLVKREASPKVVYVFITAYYLAYLLLIQIAIALFSYA